MHRPSSIKSGTLYIIRAFLGLAFLFSNVFGLSISTVQAVAPDSIVAVDGVDIPNGPDEWPNISADGRYIAFSSSSGNLIEDDNNDLHDMYVYDTVTQTFERLNVNDDEEVSGEAFSGRSHTISDDGRYVVFYSDGDNLVPNDTNFMYDVFVRDRVAGTTERVNVGPGGLEADSDGWDGIISGDGNIVVFASEATNLDPTSTNAFNWALYAHNRSTDETRLITKGESTRTWTDGSVSYPDGISEDGMKIVFNAYDDSDPMIAGTPVAQYGTFMYDWNTDTVELISQSTAGVQANGQVMDEPDISSDGRYVVFTSWATNLVAGDTNAAPDIFMRDTQTGTTTRVAESFPGVQEGTEEPRISADGTKLLFRSDTLYDSSGNPIGDNDDSQFGTYDGLYWIKDLNTGNTEQLDMDVWSSNDIFNISGDGSTAVIEFDLNNYLRESNTMIYDIASHTYTLMGEDQVFCSYYGDGIFTHSDRSDLSTDGRYVAYETTTRHIIWQNANNSWGNDIFVYDSQTGATEMASLSSSEVGSVVYGDQSNDPGISADGNYVVYESTADNFVAGDTNGLSDIFVRDRLAGTTERVNLAAGGVQATGGNSTAPSISSDGRYVAFTSAATNLVVGDANGVNDVFVYDRTLGTIKRLQVAGATHLLNPQITPDGLKVAFTARISGIDQIILYTIADDTFVNVTAGTLSSSNPDVSSDGSYVVFQSFANNLVAGDTNGASDVFLYNAGTTVTTLLSQYNSALGNGGSFEPKISDNGTVIVFDSVATNLIDNDTNGVSDVFKYDTSDSTLERITEHVNGDESLYASTYKNISGDGQFVAVSSMNKLFTGTCINNADGLRFDRAAMFLIEPGEPNVPTAPTVITSAASALGETSATLNGDITDIGSQAPTERGFEYGLTNAYGTTVSDSGSFGTGAFSEALTGLVCNTLYYFRAFATSPDGTGNGSELTFTTSACPASGGGGSSSGSTSNNDDQSTPPVVPPVQPPLDTPPAANEDTSGNTNTTPPSDESSPSETPTDSSSEESNQNTEPVTEPINTIPVTQPVTNPTNERGSSRDNSNSSTADTILLAYRESLTPLTALTATNLALLMALIPIASASIPFATTAAALGLGFAGLRMLYTRYLYDLLSFLGLRKKRRVWGTVYDSHTKQPLDPAVVELINAETGEVIERAITDLAGRFGFLATTGVFMLRASKTHYAFPSVKESGEKDEIFDNLYHGERLTLEEGSSLIAPNIPMDPIGYDWNQDAKQKLIPSRLRLQYVVQILFNALFIIGFGFALINVFLSPNLWNYFVLAMYFVILLLRFLIGRKHLWGRLSRNGQPVSGARLELTESQMGVVMGKALTAPDGKFFLKTPQPGSYKLSIKPSADAQPVWTGQVTVGKESVYNEEINI